MRDLAFYDAGTHDAKGPRRLLVLARRAMRRILRPFFQRLVEILSNLCDRLDAAEAAERALLAEVRHLSFRHEQLSRRHDHLADQLQETIAFGWDYVAMGRRLAALEERVEALTARAEAGGPPLPSHLRAHGPHVAPEGEVAR